MTGPATGGGLATRASLIAQSLAVYLGFVVVAAALLIYHPIRLIDYEELDYGELPIALVDGLVSFENLASFQTYAREGSLLLWAPAVGVVFALFGPSLFSLKLAGIFIGGLWAVAWFWVARLAIPRAPPLLVGLALVFPVPLVQISSLSITSVMAHFGTSLWHGAALLASCVAVTSGERSARRAAGLAGLASGLGLYCGYSLLPLLPGVLWVLLRRGRASLLGAWLIGMLPGLGLLAAFLAHTALEGVETAHPIGPYSFELLHKLLVYGAGVYVGTERILPNVSVFSPAAVLYPALLVGVVGISLRHRQGPDREHDELRRSVTAGLVISSLGMLGALWATRYTIDLWAFDGLRYFLPLAAPTTLLLLSAATRLPRPGPRVAICALIALNVGAYGSLVSPLERAEFLHLTKGYRGSFFLHASYREPLPAQTVRSPRATHYAFWRGVADTLRSELNVSQAGRAASFPSLRARAEYWRGVGLGRSVAAPCLARRSCVPRDTPSSLVDYVWQGVGLGSHCGDWRRTLARVPGPARESFLWGLGRGSYQDCENWPRDPAFAAGAGSSVVTRFALAGKEEALRHDLRARLLPLYAAPELRDIVERLFEQHERTDWWLR